MIFGGERIKKGVTTSVKHPSEESEICHATKNGRFLLLMPRNETSLLQIQLLACGHKDMDSAWQKEAT